MINKKKIEIHTVIFFAITIILFLLELWASDLAYENYGWAESGLLYLISFCNIIPILLFLFKKPRIAFFTLIVLGLIIIPKQLILTQKYILEKEEGANIANHIYQQKILTGRFPENLDNYTFMFPNLKNDFSYNKESEDDFIILFSVGSKNTSHYFRHSRGDKWSYYDD